MGVLDRRLNAFRDDLADSRLQNDVSAARYTHGKPARILKSIVPVRDTPDSTRSRDTEFLMGEPITVFEEKDGWAWAQSRRDGYVGYIQADAVGWNMPIPTHKICALRSHLYPAGDLKRFAVAALSYGSTVTVIERADRWSRLADGTWVYADHLQSIDALNQDPVEVAMRFLEVPYLWGGRSSEGFDCSALIQFSLEACGIPCPRDTDMQEAALGSPTESPKRGDLVFWPGHVGIMIDTTRIIHCNATDMATTVWDLAELAAHIERIEDNPIRVIKRL